MGSSHVEVDLVELFCPIRVFAVCREIAVDNLADWVHDCICDPTLQILKVRSRIDNCILRVYSRVRNLLDT